MLHRVVAVEEEQGQRYFVTRGDANSASDPWRVLASDAGWRVAFSVPLVGYLLQGFQSQLGRVLLIAIPALSLGGLMLRDVWRPSRET